MFFTLSGRVFANQVKENNLEDIANWCNGKIRGTALPRQDQIVQFDDYNGIEQDAHIGDWVVQFEKTRSFAIFPDSTFLRLFNVEI